MPAKNTLKLDVSDSYYHVYSRGVAKQPVFIDQQDFLYFRQIISRHLSFSPQASPTGPAYPHLRNHIELLAFCQMSNHFHILVYQADEGALASLMRSVLTAYGKYFNLRYKRTGPVFESRYKAKRIDNDSYLLHISRYIHMNPKRYKRYDHSSYKAYTDRQAYEWLQPNRILELFEPGSYGEFCEDYTSRREILANIKDQLANY